MSKSLSRQQEDALLQFKKYVIGAKRERKLGVFRPLRFAEKLLQVLSPRNEIKKR